MSSVLWGWLVFCGPGIEFGISVNIDIVGSDLDACNTGIGRRVIWSTFELVIMLSMLMLLLLLL